MKSIALVLAISSLLFSEKITLTHSPQNIFNQLSAANFKISEDGNSVTLDIRKGKTPLTGEKTPTIYTEWVGTFGAQTFSTANRSDIQKLRN